MLAALGLADPSPEAPDLCSFGGVLGLGIEQDLTLGSRRIFVVSNEVSHRGFVGFSRISHRAVQGFSMFSYGFMRF